jgi:hypothetical protein
LSQDKAATDVESSAWTLYGEDWNLVWAKSLAGTSLGARLEDARSLLCSAMAERGIDKKQSYALAVNVTASPEWKAERLFHRYHYEHGDRWGQSPQEGGPPSVDSDDVDEWWLAFPDGWNWESKQEANRQRIAESVLLFTAPPEFQWAFFTAWDPSRDTSLRVLLGDQREARAAAQLARVASEVAYQAASTSFDDAIPPAALWDVFDDPLRWLPKETRGVAPGLAKQQVDKEMPRVGQRVFPRVFRSSGVYNWGFEGSEYVSTRSKPTGRKVDPTPTLWIYDTDGNLADADHVGGDVTAINELLRIWHRRHSCGCGNRCNLDAVLANPGKGAPSKEEAPRAKAHRQTLARWVAKLQTAKATQAAIGQVIERNVPAVSKLKKEGADLLEAVPPAPKRKPVRPCAGCGVRGGVLRKRLNPKNMRLETGFLCAACAAEGDWKEMKVLDRVEGVTGDESVSGRQWRDAQDAALGTNYDERREFNEERGHDL